MHKNWSDSGLKISTFLKQIMKILESIGDIHERPCWNLELSKIYSLQETLLQLNREFYGRKFRNLHYFSY